MRGLPTTYCGISGPTRENIREIYGFIIAENTVCVISIFGNYLVCYVLDLKGKNEYTFFKDFSRLYSYSLSVS